MTKPPNADDPLVSRDWPWCVYDTAAGQQIRHSNDRCDISTQFEAARQLNAYAAALESMEARAARLEVALIQAIRCLGHVSGDGFTVLLAPSVTTDGWPPATLHAEPMPNGNTLWRVRAS